MIWTVTQKTGNTSYRYSIFNIQYSRILTRTPGSPTHLRASVLISTCPASMISTTLPVELLETILALAIELHPCPSHILCVNSTFRDIGNYILYTRLHFHTLRQLLLFSWHNDVAIPYQPRELRITLAGGAATHNAFLYLGGVLRKCLNDRSPTARIASSASHIDIREDISLLSLPLDVLSLRFNSHVNNPKLKDIYEALILAK